MVVGTTGGNDGVDITGAGVGTAGGSGCVDTITGDCVSTTSGRDGMDMTGKDCGLMALVLVVSVEVGGNDGTTSLAKSPTDNSPVTCALTGVDTNPPAIPRSASTPFERLVFDRTVFGWTCF